MSLFQDNSLGIFTFENSKHIVGFIPHLIFGLSYIQLRNRLL